MRIAVFSDSHNDIKTIRQATARVMPDMIFHLGDMVSDAKALQIAFPDIPLYRVAGNNDYGREAEDTLEVELCGKRMVLTHGHLFSVEGGTAELRQYAASKKCTIALFGHTHEAFARLRHGVWLLNPGRVGRRTLSPYTATYGILTLEDGGMRWELVEIPENNK
ncbi:MAG: YfcE family phosphodiesterase [Clostridiaceae bacterium]|nr:YfcE family phosphodiesterase [Clostridiaceae bacterium]